MNLFCDNPLRSTAAWLSGLCWLKKTKYKYILFIIIIADKGSKSVLLSEKQNKFVARSRFIYNCSNHKDSNKINPVNSAIIVFIVNLTLHLELTPERVPFPSTTSEMDVSAHKMKASLWIACMFGYGWVYLSCWYRNKHVKKQRI